MDFGDDFAAKEDVDPAAEFLAREQSALGDLEAEITGGSASAPPAASTDEGLGELLGGTASEGDLLSAGGTGGLESSTGSFEVIGGESNEPVGISGPPPSREEPEKIRKWREEQKQRLEEKDIEEERKRRNSDSSPRRSWTTGCARLASPYRRPNWRRGMPRNKPPPWRMAPSSRAPNGSA